MNSGTVKSQAFADCTYEGDLAALAKAAYRVGREARSEYQEPHAGRCTPSASKRRSPTTGFPVESADGRLNLRYYHITHGDILLPESTGEGDSAVMASNFRFVLCTDPDNRIRIEKPANYDAEQMAKQISGTRIEMPNQKFSWNRPEPLPFKDRWAEATWAQRDRMTAELLNLTLQKLWFLQHDPSVPAAERAFWRECGCPRTSSSRTATSPGRSTCARPGASWRARSSRSMTSCSPPGSVGRRSTPTASRSPTG